MKIKHIGVKVLFETKESQDMFSKIIPPLLTPAAEDMCDIRGTKGYLPTEAIHVVENWVIIQ